MESPPGPQDGIRIPARSRAGGTAAARGRAYGATLLIVAACTAVAGFMDRHFDPANLTMIYLLGVVAAAIAFGRAAAIFASVLSVAVFDFVFVPPRFTFRVSDTQYLVTFGVMLVVATVIGTLTAWLREQREEARLREHRTAALHRLSRDLALRGTTAEVARAAAERMEEVMEARVAISLGESAGGLRLAAGDPSLLAGEQAAAAGRALEGGYAAAAGAAARSGVHVRLEAGTTVLGVLSVGPEDPGAFDDRERFHLLRALASQVALALERCRLAEDMEQARLESETERSRSALLSSVSHDLRTPLASITGAASSLRDGAGAMSEATRHELAETIVEEAVRLNRLIGNLLDMTRLESGMPRLRKEWHSLEEVVGAALARLEPGLRDRPVRLALPPDLPLVPLDDVLFEQVVRNLIENADKYSPPREPIDIEARIEGEAIRLDVADHGPGLAPGEEHRLFEKFYRGAHAAALPGVGLGLSICQAIVRAHGGTIEARNRPGGGALFTVRLPREGTPPAVEEEAPEETPASVAT